MKIFTSVLIFLTCLYADGSYAQRRCTYQLDTLRIQTNQDLPRLLQEFTSNSFEVPNNKKAIPKFIRTQLACLADGFSIANPDQPYQAADLVFKRLQNRQLVYLATNGSMIVMTYQRGGFVASGHVLLIKFRNKEITDF